MNLSITDYKYGLESHYIFNYRERNLYFIAGLNDEIGILMSLYSLIPDLINNPDIDGNTALSVCYQE